VPAPAKKILSKIFAAHISKPSRKCQTDGREVFDGVGS
jgi:hypothetical protein